VDAGFDLLRLPREIVDLSRGDSLEVLLFRKGVSARSDQLKVVSVQLIRRGDIGTDKSAKAASFDLGEIDWVDVRDRADRCTVLSVPDKYGLVALSH
jgi:hypothetical protein